MDSFGRGRVGKIELDQCAVHFQDTPAVFSEAQPATKDNAVTVFPQLRETGGTWPGVPCPCDVLIHCPLDKVFSPYGLKSPLPEHHHGAYRRAHSDSSGPRWAGLHCLYFGQHPAIILDWLTEHVHRDNTAHRCIPDTTGVCGRTHHQKPKDMYETATCVDASLSYSRHGQGTCPHHHGVRYWFT
ncbi:hypothetical protein ABT288_27355 [Streptomyces sp. NPDC001093]|uniref:hypothetical protein n=1 Tax=Streptomyces sp. NPDC001093 TaxID=3154376 RepID=UPI0033324583